MYSKKHRSFILIVLPLTVLFFSGCTSWQRLPGAETTDAVTYIKKCSVCHAVPHPSRIDYHQWKDKIVVMKDKQMPVITGQEKKSVLSYIKNRSKKDLKTYKLRCGQCHEIPEVAKLIPDAWEDLIVVLDGDMPVFSEEEKSSVIRYLQTFAKK